MKTITIPNHNNKLANDVFIHIDKAPEVPVLESQLPFPRIVQELVLSQNKTALDMLASGPSKAADSFEAEMIDFVRLELGAIGSVFTYMSHGIDRVTFINQIRTANPDVQLSDEYAIYIYKKKTI